MKPFSRGQAHADVFRPTEEHFVAVRGNVWGRPSYILVKISSNLALVTDKDYF